MTWRIYLAAFAVLAVSLWLWVGFGSSGSQSEATAEVEATHVVGKARCGVELWAVKTLTDPGAKSVRFQPKVATVAALGALTPDRTGSSRSPLEHGVYRVQAMIVKVKREDDSDYHLILSEGGAEMIAEMPYVGCTYGAQGRYAMFLARQRLEQRVGAIGTSWKTVNLPAMLTGVLFFDFAHGQSGHAPNYSELHPAIGVKWAS